MKVATLQFDPRIGDVEGNIRKADEILKKREDELKGLDLLVLPEMAFTGYNFPSSKAIAPYMEPPQDGPSTKWAQSTSKRLNCVVCVGYPELKKLPQTEDSGKVNDTENTTTNRYYNSAIITNQTGESLFNYRKRFLYYTDETWAEEGDIPWGGLSLPIDSPQQSPTANQIPTSVGICMDINPYQFKASYEDYEFASHVLQSGSRLVVLPLAWLTMLSKEELESTANAPDMDTFNYWIQRFWPLITGEGKGGGGVSTSEENETRETVIVFANRIGEELGEGEGHSTARYAGTSTIMAIRRQGGGSIRGGGVGDLSRASILLWDMLGRGEEGLCVADTSKEPKSVFRLKRRSAGSDGGSDSG
ncbi:Carbon-nitrogen hydrolase [Arachnomyces sp. PD_36]|nr:Carbon-nitrogen hydrolase [Arachnomyces sp. PD_36]